MGKIIKSKIEMVCSSDCGMPIVKRSAIAFFKGFRGNPDKAYHLGCVPEYLSQILVP